MDIKPDSSTSYPGDDNQYLVLQRYFFRLSGWISGKRGLKHEAGEQIDT
ncbi:hypothetical protein [Brevundimonas naejangsanensis]|jgi:hypothetical protein|nr:hypothetical protein [Brevundimonas diminuta]